MKTVPSKRQVLKPIKLLESIANGGNGVLIRSTAILRTNDQCFILLRSIGSMENRRRLTTCGFISRGHAGMHSFTTQC